MKLKLIPNTSAYLFETIAPDADQQQVNYKVNIIEARLFIRTKHISPSLILGQERVLQTKIYSIPFTNVITNTLSILSGTSEIEFDNVYQGKLPYVVIFAMVSYTDMSGWYQANPFHFQHFGETTFPFRLMRSKYQGWLISQILPIMPI